MYLPVGVWMHRTSKHQDVESANLSCLRQNTQRSKLWPVTTCPYIFFRILSLACTDQALRVATIYILQANATLISLYSFQYTSPKIEQRCNTNPRSIRYERYRNPGAHFGAILRQILETCSDYHVHTQRHSKTDKPDTNNTHVACTLDTDCPDINSCKFGYLYIYIYLETYGCI